MEQRRIASSRILNGLSVDVEDWFQVGAFENTIDRADWNGLALRVADNVKFVLDLFDACAVKATFFTLGWVAEREPAAIRSIVERGHELASHGYDHARVFTLTPEQFAADLAKTRAILEDAGGAAITGYRAPSFSIDAVTTAQIGERRLAAGGGGFFRVLPYAFSRWAIARVNDRDERPAIFYFHPWEIDPDQPRMKDAPLRSRLRHYTNLSTMADKLRRLAGDFSWGRMDEIARIEAQRCVPFVS